MYCGTALLFSLQLRYNKTKYSRWCYSLISIKEDANNVNFSKQYCNKNFVIHFHARLSSQKGRGDTNPSRIQNTSQFLASCESLLTPHHDGTTQVCSRFVRSLKFWLRLRSCFGWMCCDSAPMPTHFEGLDSDSCLNSKVSYLNIWQCLNDRIRFSH